MRKDASMTGTVKYERAENDFYPTEPDATEAIYRFLLSNSFIAKDDEVLEPACGDGAITRVFEEHGHKVHSSDLYPRLEGAPVKNFLTDPFEDIDGVHTLLITNPPYALPWIDLFIARTIELVKERGFVGALLMRNEADCAVSRRPFFENCKEFTAKVVLNWRPRWVPGSTGSPRHNYSWYVWGPWDLPATINYVERPKT